jgi:hypothetical protein
MGNQKDDNIYLISLTVNITKEKSFYLNVRWIQMTSGALVTNKKKL